MKKTAEVRQPYRRYTYYNRSAMSPTAQRALSMHSARQPKRALLTRHRNLILTMLFVLACAGLFAGGKAVLRYRTTAARVAQARAHAAAEVARQQKIASFGAQVNAIIVGNPGITFSVTAIDISTGAEQHIGDQQSFAAASTAKLLTAAAYMSEVEQGRLSLAQVVDGQTAQYLLQQMVVLSDDTAWVELNDLIGHAELAAYAQSLGIADYNAADNLLGSDDIAGILQKLYTGALMHQAHQQLVLGWLKQANYRDFIIPAVPNGDTIYHKAGEVDDDVHDAAIITNGSHAMVLVIFSDGNGTYEWENRAKLFQRITAVAVEDYLGQAS